MYQNGQHAFDHSCVYHIIEHGSRGEVLLDQYLVFTFSNFYKIGRNGLTKSSIGKFTTNVTLDVVGKTYVNEYGYLFERCNHPVGFFKKQKYSVSLVNNGTLNLGTSDAKIMNKLHEYCVKLTKEKLDIECRFTDREFFFTTSNGIKLVDLHNKYPISPFAIEVMKGEYDQDAAMLSTFNLLSTQKRELDKASYKPIDPREERTRSLQALGRMNGGPNSYIDGDGVYHSNPNPVTSTLDWAHGL